MTQKVYVGSLSYNTTEDSLRTLFAEYGEIESVNLITDRDTGQPKGFAIVEMATDQATLAAISALNGKSLDEREIKVDKAKPQSDRGRRDARARGGSRGPRSWIPSCPTWKVVSKQAYSTATSCLMRFEGRGIRVARA